METPFSLARFLNQAADAWPENVALMSETGTWSFVRLQAFSQQQARNLTGNGPHIHTGSNGELALAAYACSQAGRPWWPCDPERPLPTHHGQVEAELIIATSGSEGQPKAVPLTPQNLTAAAQASNQVLPLYPGDIWLNCLPLFHIGGAAILWRCALAGATVLLEERFSPKSLDQHFSHTPVTHISLVPAMLARLLEADIAPPASLRHALIGGAALAEPLYRRGIAAGWPLRPTYGMSESTAQIATYTGPVEDWREGLVGHPLPGVLITPQADGRLRIAGPQVMQGYLGQPAASPLGFLSSDLGKLLPDGQVAILGRADDMLNCGGKKIAPHTVESCLAACPGVRDVAVTGQPDPAWGNRIVAVVVGNADAATLRSWADHHLPKAARPRDYLHQPSLPRTAAGKVDRQALRRMVRDLPGTATP